jgi:hypothetical protein
LAGDNHRGNNGHFYCFIVADLAISWAQGQPILRLFALLTAVLVWLIGRICRSVSA